MSNSRNQKTSTQLAQAIAALLRLKKDVTAQDRKEAAKELGLGIATVHRYLAGDGSKLVIALDLIEFFKGRIQGRQKRLDKIAA